MGFKCIKMDQPSMACNADDVPSPGYRMQNTREVAWGTPVASLMANIRDVAKGLPKKPPRKVGSEWVEVPPMNNLILNCHGAPGQLKLGQWIDHTHAKEFERLKGLVQWIWLNACEVASRDARDDFTPWDITDRPYKKAQELVRRLQGKPVYTAPSNAGDEFCRKIAKATGAYVIASPTMQRADMIYLPKFMIDGFEGIVYCYFPNGTKDRIKNL